MKILIVDDVGLIRRRLQQMLEERGYDVATASGGREAVAAVQADNRIGLVLTDLYMAGMSGVELWHAVRQIERLDDTGPIAPPEFILITASRPSDDKGSGHGRAIQEARNLGFKAVLHKPIDQKMLFHEVASVAARVSRKTSPSETRAEPVSPTPGVLDAHSLEVYREELRKQLRSVDSALTLMKEAIG